MRLHEFDPTGYNQSFTLYTGDDYNWHKVDTFATLDDAKDEVQFIQDADPRTKAVFWQIKDINDKVVWTYDPGEIADAMRRGSRIQFIKPDDLTESTYTDHKKQIKHFILWCKEKLNITKPLPKMVFADKKEGPDQHHTGYYDDDSNTMWIYTGNRNLIDIMRTVCHELVHRKQHEYKKAKPGESYPFAPIEQEADAVAGGLIKLYVREYPASIE